MEAGTAYQYITYNSTYNFQSRWRKEFVATLQNRQKWKIQKRNFCVGDIVILKEDTQHNDWGFAKMIEVYKYEKSYKYVNSSVVPRMFRSS